MTTTTAVRERPILFSGPMVRAILDGRKTQTRRVIKPQPDTAPGMNRTRLLFRDRAGRDTVNVAVEAINSGLFLPDSPYGNPGDRLWVRETWAVGLPALATGEGFVPFFGRPSLLTEPAQRALTAAKLVYAASWDGPDVPPFRPPIHMPRWASRLTLEVTGVRVERVQDIRHNVADLEAEGVALSPSELFPHTNRESKLTRVYEKLWDSLNAKRGFGWPANPWVWVVEFRLVDGVA